MNISLLLVCGLRVSVGRRVFAMMASYTALSRLMCM